MMPNAEIGMGFKWPVARSLTIAVSAQSLWDVISAPGHLERCHPFCAANPVTRWSGAASIDEVHYLNGLVFERRFCGWETGIGYDLEIGVKYGKTSHVSWRLSPAAPGACVLGLTVYPFLLQNLPAAIRWFPYRWRVQPMLESYLDSVLKGVAWYSMRGEPVPRNQFGRHPWFSAKDSGTH
jgi:hypothetical protein